MPGNLRLLWPQPSMARWFQGWVIKLKAQDGVKLHFTNGGPGAREGPSPAWVSQPGVSSGAQPRVGLGLRAFSWGNEGNGSRGLPSGRCGTGRPHSITHAPVTAGKAAAPRGHVPGTEALGAGPWWVHPDATTLGGVPRQRGCRQPRRRLSSPP